jgi:hypothetical protein
MHFVGPLCRKWPETARFDKVCDKGSRQRLATTKWAEQMVLGQALAIDFVIQISCNLVALRVFASMDTHGRQS